MDVLYIVIPAYNEEANIKSTIEEWYPIVEQYNGNGYSRLVIVDDGSKDSTFEIMKEYAEKLIQDMERQCCLHISMQYNMEPISFFRQIQMDKHEQRSFTIFGVYGMNLI